MTLLVQGEATQPRRQLILLFLRPSSELKGPKLTKRPTKNDGSQSLKNVRAIQGEPDVEHRPGTQEPGARAQSPREKRGRRESGDRQGSKPTHAPSILEVGA